MLSVQVLTPTQWHYYAVGSVIHIALLSGVVYHDSAWPRPDTSVSTIDPEAMADRALPVARSGEESKAADYSRSSSLAIARCEVSLRQASQANATANTPTTASCRMSTGRPACCQFSPSR